MKFGPANTVRLARALRRKMSLPEVLLWRQLRGDRLGVRFRRQHPIGPFVLDFYCEPAKLAVEVDGAAHHLGDRPRRDAERDAWLVGSGVRTLRLPARVVLKDMDAAIRMILHELEDRAPQSGLRPDSSPKGEHPPRSPLVTLASVPPTP